MLKRCRQKRLASQPFLGCCLGLCLGCCLGFCLDCCLGFCLGWCLSSFLEGYLKGCLDFCLGDSLGCYLGNCLGGWLGCYLGFISNYCQFSSLLIVLDTKNIFNLVDFYINQLDFAVKRKPKFVCSFKQTPISLINVSWKPQILFNYWLQELNQQNMVGSSRNRTWDLSPP